MSRVSNLKEEELCRKVGEEVDVQDEDGVHEDAAEGGPEDEEPPSVGVGPRSGEEGVDHRRDGLQDAVVPLQLSDVLLHPNLLVAVVEVEVGADVVREAEVDAAHLKRKLAHADID